MRSIAYRTVPARELPVAVRERLLGGAIDVLTFASPSSARRLADRIGIDAFGEWPLPFASARSRPTRRGRSASRSRPSPAEPSVEGIVAALLAWQREERETGGAAGITGTIGQNLQTGTTGKGA